jgi:protein-L-isoaspartate(D-aspartate) O-methyltransferase
MTDAAQRHEALMARLRETAVASDRILDAFARVPRHQFLPEVPLEVTYSDDAIVTHDEGGVPTSSSSQPSLMARMLEQLEVGPGDRVLEIGAGTGYNAAVMAELGAAVTTVELQPEVADAAREHLREAGMPVASDDSLGGSGAAEAGRPAFAGEAIGAPAVQPGSVLVVTGDGAVPPDGPYDRVIVTAGCWSLPPAVVDSLADGGVLVAPLRINGVELALGLRREGDVLRGSRGIPCGFMPMRGGDERPWRWQLGGGGVATADADLGVEGRGAVDRLLATPGREVEDPIALRDGEHALGALLWLGLRGDPLLSLVRPGRDGRPPWTVGLVVLPASLLVLELASGYAGVASACLHGGDAALRTCVEAMAAWRAAGSPGPAALELTIERHGGRTGWSLPFTTADGASTMVRGAHRWTLRYAPGERPE